MCYILHKQLDKLHAHFPHSKKYSYGAVKLISNTVR